MGSQTHYEEPIVRALGQLRENVCRVLEGFRKSLPSRIQDLAEQWENEFHELIDELQEALLKEWFGE